MHRCLHHTIVVLLFLSLLAPLTIFAQSPDPPSRNVPHTIALPESAFCGPIHREPAEKPPAKLSSDLHQHLSGNASVAGLRSDTRQRIQTQITIDPKQVSTVREAIARLGGTVTGASFGDTMLQAWLPENAIMPLTQVKSVWFIRSPQRPAPASHVELASYTTEALGPMRADDWHAAGQTGEGVKIGIIDGGFAGYKSLIGSDLPSAGRIVVANFCDGESPAEIDATSSHSHGTACAEIIHDVAPGATLYLAKAYTFVDVHEAAEWLVDQGVGVISMSAGWTAINPGDGTDGCAPLIEWARDQGTLWVNSAGNYRDTHWGGYWYDPDADGTLDYIAGTNVNWFGPGDGDAFLIPRGAEIRGSMRWSDWDCVTQDYSLILVRWDDDHWVQVAEANDIQCGGPGQEPSEFISYETAHSECPYGLVIVRRSGTRPVNFELFVYDWPLTYQVPARSLSHPGDVPDALTVAAVGVDSPYSQEYYSSEGPTNGPGGIKTGGYFKPNLAAYAGVATTSYGAGGFSGTSAAAPHVAGAAALVLGAYPHYSPSQIESFLEGRAIDQGTWGRDYDYGYGRLYLGAPPPTPTPTRTCTSTRTNTPTTTASATPTDTHTPTVTPTPSSTATGVPSATNSPTPTETYTPSPTATGTCTPTPTDTCTPTVTATPLPSLTPEVTLTSTNTPTITCTPTVGPCMLPLVQRLSAPTHTPTVTPTSSTTPTGTLTQTATSTHTWTATSTSTPDDPAPTVAQPTVPGPTSPPPTVPGPDYEP